MAMPYDCDLKPTHKIKILPSVPWTASNPCSPQPDVKLCMCHTPTNMLQLGF